MEHPLQNPSLTPVGFVFPFSRERLEYIPPPGRVDGDRVSAEFWQEQHRMTSPQPLPVRTILHDILPSTYEEETVREYEVEFRGKWYAARDIMVLSSVVQWFGTSVGNSFLTETSYPFDRYVTFAQKFAYEEKRSSIFVQLTHECTDACAKQGISSSFNPRNHHNKVTIEGRDRKLIEALMLWFDTPGGIAYRKAYREYRAGVIRTAREQRCAVA